MAERPILFNDAMVRAILDGRKTQTRRPVKPQPNEIVRAPYRAEEVDTFIVGDPRVSTEVVHPPCFVGDLLWVRECFALGRVFDESRAAELPIIERDVPVWYRADGSADESWANRGKWRPSIHMPRWASRISLRVTDVRVERVQDISAADATAEGARRFEGLAPSFTGSTEAKWSMFSPKTHGECLGSARMAFANGWNCAYACGPSSWEANPFCWVVEFERI